MHDVMVLTGVKGRHINLINETKDMAIDSPKVISKIKEQLAERTKNYKHNDITSSDILRNGLSASVVQGMREAFDQVRNKGRDLAFRVLGVDTSWSSWDLKNGPLRTSLMTELQPDVDELAKMIATEFRAKDLDKMTKTRKQQLMKSLRRRYEDEVESQVQNHFAEQIAEQARKDVEDMWNHVPSLLKDGVTMEDIVAEHFTSMIAQDADRDEQVYKENLENVRRHMEWMLDHRSMFLEDHEDELRV